MTSRESKYNFLCWMTGISNTQMHNDGFRYSIQQWYIQSSLNQWCIIRFSLFSILSRQMVHTLIYLSNDFRTIIIHENISLLISGGLKAWGSLLLTFQFGNICFGSGKNIFMYMYFYHDGWIRLFPVSSQVHQVNRIKSHISVVWRIPKCAK